MEEKDTSLFLVKESYNVDEKLYRLVLRCALNCVVLHQLDLRGTLKWIDEPWFSSADPLSQEDRQKLQSFLTLAFAVITALRDEAKTEEKEGGEDALHTGGDGSCRVHFFHKKTSGIPRCSQAERLVVAAFSKSAKMPSSLYADCTCKSFIAAQKLASAILNTVYSRKCRDHISRMICGRRYTDDVELQRKAVTRVYEEHGALVWVATVTIAYRSVYMRARIQLQHSKIPGSLPYYRFRPVSQALRCMRTLSNSPQFMALKLVKDLSMPGVYLAHLPPPQTKGRDIPSFFMADSSSLAFWDMANYLAAPIDMESQFYDARQRVVLQILQLQDLAHLIIHGYLGHRRVDLSTATCAEADTELDNQVFTAPFASHL